MLLDTNAYSALARAVPAVVEAVSPAAELKLPLPVIAELRYGFAKGSQAERNEQQLQKFLAQSQVSIIMPTVETTAYYASLQLFCHQRDRALSHNDIWIAALAQETDSILVTFDRDFEVLAESFGDKLIILEEPVAKQQQALTALVALGKSNGPIKSIPDPVAWQRQQRTSTDPLKNGEKGKSSKT